MGRKRMPGLYRREEVWHIDKKIFGHRLCESTGTGDLEEAEKYLARRSEEVRQASVYGVRPKRIFQDAATKFLMENQHKRSLNSDAGRLKVLVNHIGNMTLESIHMGSLQPYIEARRRDGVKMRTINHGLKVVRRICNLAASEWMDEYGLTWMANAPKIRLLPEHDLRKPYPLSWEEQNRLFRELPTHLQKMALFAVNTGCRDGEICKLQWDWEIKIAELPKLVVFIIPSVFIKNGEERLVVCNDTARTVVEEQRGTHPTHVFSFRERPLVRMLNSAWRAARKRADLKQVRVHDLKHTFERRLRSVGVSLEDRQDLLGHVSERITTHYSAAELQNLYKAANRVCESHSDGVTLTLLRCANSMLTKENQPHTQGASL